MFYLSCLFIGRLEALCCNSLFNISSAGCQSKLVAICVSYSGAHVHCLCCCRQLLTDGEVYMVQNPYIVPDQRAFHLLQYVANKGPRAPAKLLQSLVDEPLHQGHMYLAARLLGESKKGESLSSLLHCMELLCSC